MRKAAISTSMFYPLLLLAFWTGLMLAADYVVIGTSVRQALSVSFSSTLGKVVQSEVGQGAVSHRGVEMGYDYTVNGVKYRGTKYRYDDRNAAWEYSAAVNAFPRWSMRKVYYNPRNPADSILDPGLEGCDLLLLLFATPLNAVTVALWLWVAQWRREKAVSEPAGGIRILKRGGEIRAQLAAFSPAAAALAALGIGPFLLAFPVVSVGGFAPSMTLMAAVWALVLMVVGIAIVWTLNRNRSGSFDLRIDEVSRAVTLPRIDGRKTPLILAHSEIGGVLLECRTARTPSGDYFSYLPAIDRAGGEMGPIRLVESGWTEAKASAFGQWLSRELGVEFRGTAADRAES